MSLLTINDPEKITVIAEVGLQGHPVVELQGTSFDYSVLKFGQLGCSEVLGYQLAWRMGVPVMPVIPVWRPKPFNHGGQLVGEGRIGLAVQYSEAFENVTWEEAASQAQEVVIASLVLCLLTHGEWGQLAETKFGRVFYDLEGLFPALCPERMDDQSWADVIRQVSDAGDAYRDIDFSFGIEVIKLAKNLRITESLRVAVEKAATISQAELLSIFDLEPHPLAAQIENIAADVSVMQLKYAAKLLGSLD